MESRMKWQARFVKNAVFGMMPWSEKIRMFKRKIVSYPSTINKSALEDGIRMVEMLNEGSSTIKGKTVIEIGTGWQPVVPILFYLSGCSKIITIDTQRLLDKRLLIESSLNLLSYKDLIAHRLGLSFGSIEKMLDIDTKLSLEQALNKFNITYKAPFDINKADIKDKSIDIVISRAVLEHIPPEIIKNLLETINRILRDEGKMCHVIDNSDHWEHKDKSITKLNYLKFHKTIFKAISSFNPLDYQNRLRHFEYINMFKKSGFRIEKDKSETDYSVLEDLSKIRICDKYKDVDHKDLAVLTSYIIASK
jgi:SAM-dependent methyltransferase